MAAYNGMGHRSTPVSDMNFNRSKAQYVSVQCVLILMRETSMLIGTATDKSDTIKEHWIPLSLIHSADETKLRQVQQIDRVTFRLMEWKAKELGL